MKIVGIKLNGLGKTYFFDSNGYNLKIDDEVIVETEKGLQYGVVVSLVPDDEVNKKMEYKNVIRICNKNDIRQYHNNLKDAKRALDKCNEKIIEYELDMRIIDACYTFDRSQLIFRFVSDNRVDFRDLAKELGSIFKTRIELRQVGIRDKAREIGGIGPCGRILCCNKFLTDFDSVSINMAKNQLLSLNPTKINGVCGRLLCCLKYENDNYTEYREGLPEVGKKATVDGRTGKVLSVDVFNRTYTIMTPENEILKGQTINESKK